MCKFFVLMTVLCLSFTVGAEEKKPNYEGSVFVSYDNWKKHDSRKGFVFVNGELSDSLKDLAYPESCFDAQMTTLRLNMNSSIFRYLKEKHEATVFVDFEYGEKTDPRTDKEVPKPLSFRILFGGTTQSGHPYSLEFVRGTWGSSPKQFIRGNVRSNQEQDSLSTKLERIKNLDMCTVDDESLNALMRFVQMDLANN